MRQLINLVVVAAFLTGCSTIKTMIPRDHDPVMFDQLVSIHIQLNQTNCSNKDWSSLFDKVHHLKVYSDLRGDPQATSVSQLEEALLKANSSKSEVFCSNILKINKTRVEVIEDAWKGR
jgi:uncharacterized protein YcfL